MAWLWSLLAAVHYGLVLLVILSVLRQRKEPMAMLAWILAATFLPVLGLLLYWLVGSSRVRRKVSRRRKRIARIVARIRDQTIDRATGMHVPTRDDLPEDLALIEHLTQRLMGVPATRGNRLRIYQKADATYYAIEEAIRAAERHIHLEYYIWQPDETGRHFRDLVIARARDGLECRVLMDAVGSWSVRRDFVTPMIDAGVRVAFFLPVNPLARRWHINARNHRKIAVIDSRVAFTGSQNIGDEYLGRRKRLSPWRDAHIRLEGPAVLFLQQTFAEDWYFSTREDLADERYCPAPESPGNSTVQIVATGPDQDVRVLEQVIFGAVSTAQKSIRVATPYFVPNPELLMALKHAAYRGVRVQIVLPTRHDAPVVLWAGRSFYDELIRSGVEICEYDHGVLHSKIITVDDRWCMLGSANMDIRSFRLNFEITALIYDSAATIELSESIDRDLGDARPITLPSVWRRRYHQQIIEGAARLCSPLL
ncbi:MAG: Major cardiolipin synthase ClsA [Phycisphaerae bacterium]|nr:Major cardiolipin synthase ClsA [Phycisphaerae bacterium]